MHRKKKEDSGILFALKKKEETLSADGMRQLG